MVIRKGKMKLKDKENKSKRIDTNTRIREKERIVRERKGLEKWVRSVPGREEDKKIRK